MIIIITTTILFNSSCLTGSGFPLRLHGNDHQLDDSSEPKHSTPAPAPTASAAAWASEIHHHWGIILGLGQGRNKENSGFQYVFWNALPLLGSLSSQS